MYEGGMLPPADVLYSSDDSTKLESFEGPVGLRDTQSDGVVSSERYLKDNEELADIDFPEDEEENDDDLLEDDGEGNPGGAHRVIYG